MVIGVKSLKGARGLLPSYSVLLTRTSSGPPAPITSLRVRRRVLWIVTSGGSVVVPAAGLVRRTIGVARTVGPPTAGLKVLSDEAGVGGDHVNCMILPVVLPLTGAPPG